MNRLLSLIFLAVIGVSLGVVPGSAMVPGTDLDSAIAKKTTDPIVAANIPLPQDTNSPQQLREIYIEVNIPATEMTLFENGVELFTRSVAIGQGKYPTPEASGAIKNIEWNPTWYPPPESAWAKTAKITPPGPNNPLGLVKMQIIPEILFHGTNKEWSVGTAASHGCMRMRNSEVAEIAWFLQSMFSAKSDPALRDEYRKNRGTTYKVSLESAIPVKIVYKPVVVRDRALHFYKDHYNKVGANKKWAIIKAIIDGGFDIQSIDDAKVEALANSWPAGGRDVPIKNLTFEGATEDLMDAPECS